MKKAVFLHIAVPSVFWEGLDYLPPLDSAGVNWQPGMRLRVPLGRRNVVGVLLKVKDSTHIDIQKCKRAERIDDRAWIDAKLLSLLSWVSDYYQFPIGETIAVALPKAVRQGKPIVLSGETERSQPEMSKLHEINDEQQQAISEINSANGFQVFLLEGVTGSGKTEVYMHVALRVLQQGKQVLVLVPEIGLTPQMMQRLEARFNVPVLPMHSQVADGKRFKSWTRVLVNEPCIVVGTRLSVFAPFANLGLVVVDEEHDTSFKQHSGLRYSARDVAIKRCFDLSIPIVLGSATPSFESMSNLSHKGYRHLTLPRRVSQSVMPSLHVVDVRHQHLVAGLSPPLIERMKTFLGAGQQVLLFLNRRGYAPVMMCHHCGWTVQCQSCDAFMVWHKDSGRLHCHHCEASRKSVRVCEECQQSELAPVGFGTQRLDEVLAELFPDILVLRIDRDSTRRKNSLRDMLAEVAKQQPMILVGTQMLVKGHHFPRLGLVAIVNADSGLFSVDFRAQERLAQQIIQVSGRAGRGDQPGQVILQTHHPDHPLLAQLLEHGYAHFVAVSLSERKMLSLPPFSHWAVLHAEAKNQDDAVAFIEQVMSGVQAQLGERSPVKLNGPVLAPMAKRKGFFRAQLLLSSSQRRELGAALCLLTRSMAPTTLSRRVKWALDVDPHELY